MRRRPPTSKRTYTHFPYTPLFGSWPDEVPAHARADIRQRGRDARRRDRVRRGLRWRHPLFRRLTGAEPRWSDWPASPAGRSEEHTSELQSLMRISYAVFCLKKTKSKHTIKPNQNKEQNAIQNE